MSRIVGSHWCRSITRAPRNQRVLAGPADRGKETLRTIELPTITVVVRGSVVGEGEERGKGWGQGAAGDTWGGGEQGSRCHPGQGVPHRQGSWMGRCSKSRRRGGRSSSSSSSVPRSSRPGRRGRGRRDSHGSNISSVLIFRGEGKKTVCSVENEWGNDTPAVKCFTSLFFRVHSGPPILVRCGTL